MWLEGLRFPWVTPQTVDRFPSRGCHVQRDCWIPSLPEMVLRLHATAQGSELRQLVLDKTSLSHSFLPPWISLCSFQCSLYYCTDRRTGSNRPSVCVIWFNPAVVTPNCLEWHRKRCQITPKSGVTVIPGTYQDTSNDVLPFIFRPAAPSRPHKDKRLHLIFFYITRS